MNERQGKQSKYTLSFRIVSVSFPPASSPTTSLMSCIFGCTRTHTHIQHTNACLLFMLCCLSTFTYLLFSLYLKITGINAATERQWQRAKNERRVTTATIDVRKATDGIDDGGSDVNLTDRRHTHTYTETYPSDRSREQERVRERSRQTLVHVIKVTRAAHERFRRSTQTGRRRCMKNFQSKNKYRISKITC